jgi:hypothetical protein
MEPLLGDLAALHVEDLRPVVIQRLPVTLRGPVGQGDHVLVVREDVVDVEAEGPPGQFRELRKEPEDLVLALVVEDRTSRRRWHRAFDVRNSQSQVREQDGITVGQGRGSTGSALATLPGADRAAACLPSGVVGKPRATPRRAGSGPRAGLAPSSSSGLPAPRASGGST